jgi:hypothetical protein
MKNKVRTVMKEFKSGDLKSSSGKKVTNPKQAIAIALSEAGKSKSMKEGGHMKESKEMMKKEVSFMKKKGAPKSMIKHEMKEAGMKPKAKYMSFTEKGKPAGMKPVQMAMGGMAKGMTKGMAARSSPMRTQSQMRQAEMSRMAGMARSMQAAPPAYGKNPAPAGASRSGMLKKGGAVKKMAGGGLSAGHKSADGVAKKGKTDTKQVAMKKGGAVKKMRYGGKC